MSEKKQLRQQTLKYLKNLVGTKEKFQREKALQEIFLESKEFKVAQTIGIFLPGKIEHRLDTVIEKSREENKILAIPKATNKKMTFHLFEKNTELITSTFGVLEPKSAPIIKKEELDLIIVPGLVYRKDGYRIGFGGGYYDRYLVDFKGQTVSLIFQEQLADFAKEVHDIPVGKLFVR